MRVHDIKTMALKMLEEKSSGFYKRKITAHMFEVETLSILLARKRKLNEEYAAIIGLLHDLSIAIDCNDFNHAARSASIAKKMLEEHGGFKNDEITLITTAIANHSTKDVVQDPYSELIKDADVLAHMMNQDVLDGMKKQRAQKAASELS
jgi:HD superfamily phosphodiesterase